MHAFCPTTKSELTKTKTSFHFATQALVEGLSSFPILIICYYLKGLFKLPIF